MRKKLPLSDGTGIMMLITELRYQIGTKGERLPEAIRYYRESKIDWNNLPDEISKSIICEDVDKVIKKGYITDYYFSKLGFVYENIFKINIYRDKCGKYDTMVVSFPVIISSFFTDIDFGKLYFYPGDYNLTDKIDYEMKDNSFLTLKPKENVLPK